MKLTSEGRLFLLNTFSQSLFVLFTCLTLFVGLRTTLPYIYHDDPNTHFRCKLYILFVLCNVVGNFICIKLTANYSVFCKQKSIIRLHDDYSSNNPVTVTNDVSSQNDLVPGHMNGGNGSTLKWVGGHNERKSNVAPNLTGWTECMLCNEFTPRRAKHCPLCCHCVLKRDHHCFFAGCCIGFHNQRYFTMFCIYGAIGAFYSSLTSFYYLQSNYTAVENWGIVAYFIPLLLWFWMTGSTTGSIVWLVLFLYWTTFAWFMCSYFSIVQASLVYRGQTRHEWKKGIFLFRSNLVKNFKSVFGPSRFSFIGFFIPLPLWGYFGDGKSWDELNWEGKIA